MTHFLRKGLVASISAVEALGAWLVPHAARAEAATSELAYMRGSGAQQCPDEIAVRDGVAKRLGYDPFQSPAPTTLSAAITRTPRGLRAQIEVRDASGRALRSRQLTSAANDCVELADAMTLAMSLALDPLAVAKPPAPPPPAPSPGPAAAAPPAPTLSSFEWRAAPPESPPPPAAHADPWKVHASLGTLVATGAAPAPAVGFAAGVGLRWRALSLNAEGRADLPSSIAFQGGTASTSLLLVSLVPCAHQELNTIGSLMACGVGSLGSIAGSGTGVDVPRQDNAFYAAAGARLGYEGPAAWIVAPRIYGDLLATLTSTTVHLDKAAVWTTLPVSGVVGAGAVVHFP
jgi:hypothetical protein